MPLKVRLPVAIRVELIHHHGAVLSSVPSEIALAITVKIKTARHHPAHYRSLPYSSVDYFALPFDIDWKTDVYRDKQAHRAPSLQ